MMAWQNRGVRDKRASGRLRVSGELPGSRQRHRGQLGPQALVALVTVLAIVAGTLIWAFWDVDAHMDRAQAAVVNNDEWVTVNGQIMPLGRQLAAQLVDGDATYDWVLMTEADAQKGLEDGTFAAMLIIPEDFSAKATSIAATDAVRPEQAFVTLEVSPVAGLGDVNMAKAAVEEAVDALSATICQGYLDNIYIGLGQAADGLDQAGAGASDLAEGAEQLADGVSAAAEGATQLASGLGDLADGTSSLSGGVSTLAEGASQVDSGTSSAAQGASTLAQGTRSLSAGAVELSDGVAGLATGADQLADGIEQLSSGLALLKDSTAQLPDSTDALSTGADALSTGAASLASGASSLASGISGVASAADQLAAAQTQYAQQVAALAAAHPEIPELAALASSADELASHASVLAEGAAQSSEGAEGVSTAASEVSAGATALAAGTEELAASAPALCTGIAQAAGAAQTLSDGALGLARGTQATASGAVALVSGASRVDSGAAELASGLTSLTQGTAQLASGASDAAHGASVLVKGAESAYTGSTTLAEGSNELASGTSALAEGTSALASSLTAAADEIPVYTSQERHALETVVADPVAYTEPEPHSENVALFVMFSIAALWLGTLAVYVLTEPVPRRALLLSTSSSRIAVRALVPALEAGAALSVLSSLAAWLLFELSGVQVLTFLGVMLLSAAVFAAVNQALCAIAGGWGHVISGAMLVVSLAGALVSVLPAAFRAIGEVLPANAALVLAKAITGGCTLAAGEVSVLVMWGVVGVVCTMAAVAQRRMMRVGDLEAIRT